MFANVKYGTKLSKLRVVKLTTSNLALIFKLNPLGIYLETEEEGEILLPSDDGKFEVEDTTKIYIVSGDDASQVSSNQQDQQNPNAPVARPFAVQQSSTSRQNGNPMPFERPAFSSVQKKKETWKKSIMYATITSNGCVLDKHQVLLPLNEETATIENIKRMLREKLGFAVELLDSKYLPIIPQGKITCGSGFWKGNRRVFACNVEEIKFLQQIGKRKKKQQKRQTDRGGEELVEQLRSLISSTSQQAPTPASEDFVKQLLYCTICFGTAELPAAVCTTCYRVIGCVACVEQWYASNPTMTARCTLCRTRSDYTLMPLLRDVALAVGQDIPSPPTAATADANGDASDGDTIPYGTQDVETDDGEDLVQMY